MKHLWRRVSGLVVILAVLLVAPLQAQDQSAMSPLSTIEFPRSQTSFGAGSVQVRALDVWADGNVAVVSAGPTVHVVDLSDAQTPQFNSFSLAGDNEAWDVKVQGDFVYAAVQVSRDGTALLIYDISDRDNPLLAGRLEGDGFSGAHNLFVKDNVLFLSTTGIGGAGLSGVWVVDVSDPANPVDLGPILTDRDDPNSRIRSHDLTVVGDRLFVAGWDTGIWMLEVQNLDVPSEFTYEVIANHKYEPAFRTFNAPDPATHNMWPSADGNLLWTTDEIVGEGIRVFDISDPHDMVLLDFYRLNANNALPHNVVVDGDFAYVAHYMDGLRVLTLESGNIVEVAVRDTAGNNDRSNPFRGAFGVFPHNDVVLIADTFNGLLIYAKEDLLN